MEAEFVQKHSIKRTYFVGGKFSGLADGSLSTRPPSAVCLDSRRAQPSPELQELESKPSKVAEFISQQIGAPPPREAKEDDLFSAGQPSPPSARPPQVPSQRRRLCPLPMHRLPPSPAQRLLVV